MKRVLTRGTYGHVDFKDGQAIKKPHKTMDPFANREYIAFKRMHPIVDKLSVAFLEKVDIETYTGELAFVTTLWFEDAGTDLEHWFISQWFFDPVEVLLRPLLSTLEYLEEIGLLHLDIHTRNVCVLLDARGQLTAKLIDFGRSVVLRDTEEWVCHPNHREYWIDPLTGVVSEQDHFPTPDAKEAAMEQIYNAIPCRDPLAVVALAVNGTGKFPLGLTLGPADDVYALGICVVRMLTTFVHVPWEQWNVFNTLESGTEFGEKVHLLGDIFRRNPAWDPSFFLYLHLRIRANSSNPTVIRDFKAKARAAEIYLQSVSTLYPHFFDHVTEVYDDATSQLIRACVHPDKHHRYARGWTRKEKEGEEGTKIVRRGSIDAVVVRGERVVHVSSGHCWIMTGVVESGQVNWWTVAQGAMMKDKLRGGIALKLFIDKTLELEPSLKTKHYRDWPFKFELQKEAWLRTLALYDREEVHPGRDTEPDPRPRSTGTNVPVEGRRTRSKLRRGKRRPQPGSSSENCKTTKESTWQSTT